MHIRGGQNESEITRRRWRQGVVSAVILAGGVARVADAGVAVRVAVVAAIIFCSTDGHTLRPTTHIIHKSQAVTNPQAAQVRQSCKLEIASRPLP